MRAAFLAGLLLLGASVGSHAQEPSRLQVSAGAGLVGFQGSLTRMHVGAGLAYLAKPYLTLGVDLGYTSIPRDYGRDDAFWGLMTLTAAVRSSARVSPYLVLGLGLGRYVVDRGDGEFGRAGALGVGLNVSLGSRASLFVEGRYALMAGLSVINDPFYAELPVTIGVRFRP